MKLLIWKDMAASCGFFSKHPLHTPVWRIVIQERERERERESKQQASKKLEGFLFGYAPLGGPLNHGSN